MRNDEQKLQGVMSKSSRNNGLLPNSFRAFSSYMRIVTSGASTVASTVRSAASAASAIVDRDNEATHDQVYWAGFDKLECEGDVTCRVLLLGYRYGFQVWDVEEANNVHELISRYDGAVSSMHILPKLLASKQSGDKFADSRPLLAICADRTYSGGCCDQDGSTISCNGSIQFSHDQVNVGFMPTVVWFYSLKSQYYVHLLKFNSVVYLIRCSSRVVAVLQAAQIHCFDAATLQREYTILTNPIVTSGFVSGSFGLGPLAVGPRWMAYSGSPVAISSSGRVSPQHLTPSAVFPSPASNGSLVAHYAKESSKQLAAGIVTLGDIGYKKLSRYYSDLLPEGNNYLQLQSQGWKGRGTDNRHFTNAENVGMVIVRDVVGKSIISQFRAHKSPIASLCFDPSGTLLVTASVQGHNIKVFQIMPEFSGKSSGSDSVGSYIHLYTLQRGLTNAVIQDISFSDDSHWIMISSSRGTSHLFAISPSGGFTTANSASGVNNPAVRGPPNSGLQMLNQQTLCPSGPPVTLSAVSRIRSGNNGWKSTVSGAAAAATGRSSLCGAIASAFHNCNSNNSYTDASSSKAKYHLLVFSPGCVIQYALRIASGLDGLATVSGLSPTYELAPEGDARLVVEAIQKWNICQKHNRREREDNIDIYGENGNSDSRKIFPEGMEKENMVLPEDNGKFTKVNVSPEEKHHMYISEAELQMHLPRSPLWARSEIYFQSIIKDDIINIDEEDAMGWETEIERIPTCMIEARSKDLIPVFDYVKMPKFQTVRGTALDKNNDGQLLLQRSGISHNGRLMSMSNCASLHSMVDCNAAEGEYQNGIENTGNGLLMSIQNTGGFVNNSDNAKLNARLEFVNNRDSSVKETQLKFVNKNPEGLKVGNQSEYEGGEFG